MSDFVDEESSSSTMHRHPGLSALHYWLFDFPQLEACRSSAREDDAADDNDITVLDHSADFDNVDVVSNIVQIAKEICDHHDDDDCERDDEFSPVQKHSSVSEGWAEIYQLLLDHENHNNFDADANFETRECQYNILCQLLCRALSERCPNQREYISRIMAFDRPEVQQEIMKILQDNNSNAAHRQDDGDGSDVENDDNNITGDYSTYTGDYSAVTSPSAALEYGSDATAKRSRSEAFGDDDPESDSLNGQRNRVHIDDDDDDNLYEECAIKHVTQYHRSAEEANNLRATIATLQKEIKESRQQELDLTLKVDEAQSQHRADMLHVESEYLKTIRDIEDKYTNELSEQRREIEMLRDYERSAKELKEENLRLRDDLDVLACSKEKLSFTEEQLRKCREKVELIGDAHDALLREEKAHALSVDKCLSLENELAQLKPIKRQLEEYRVRAIDAEVALAECRDDLRRMKEKSGWLEGTNIELQRGVALQHNEAVNLQKRLQEEGDSVEKGGTAVGIGMRCV